MLCTKEKCCGCGACENICPKSCISMEIDNEGFYYPRIDQQLCINCKMCETVCPAISEINQNAYKKHAIEAYSFIYKNLKIRTISSSGGFFYYLANTVINMGGIVFGAKFFDNCKKVKIVGIEKKEDLMSLMGSKYVQCIPNKEYSQVREELKKNRIVLFTGTPCQIAACKLFLGNQDLDNLILVDLICHGVPSPGVWSQYMQENGLQAEKVFFRDKTYGWKKFSLLIEQTNGIRNIERENKNIYMKGFLNDLYSRLCCYDCRYKGTNRFSDITIGDFWKIGIFNEEMDDDMGTSLLLINTCKGKKIIDKIMVNNDCICQKVDLEKAIKSNPMISKSIAKTRKRARFFKYFDTISIDSNVEQCLHISIFEKIRNKIKYMLFERKY